VRDFEDEQMRQQYLVSRTLKLGFIDLLSKRAKVGHAMIFEAFSAGGDCVGLLACSSCALQGSISGAHVWFDSEADELHFPVLVLYPETAMSDFIQV
jgi:hypothetical protein